MCVCSTQCQYFSLTTSTASFKCWAASCQCEARGCSSSACFYHWWEFSARHHQQFTSCWLASLSLAVMAISPLWCHWGLLCRSSRWVKVEFATPSHTHMLVNSCNRLQTESHDVSQVSWLFCRINCELIKSLIKSASILGWKQQWIKSGYNTKLLSIPPTDSSCGTILYLGIETIYWDDQS